ncbi:hypothetical protein ACFL0V_05325 [Nanoarchaeota archaeon]
MGNDIGLKLVIFTVVLLLIGVAGFAGMKYGEEIAPVKGESGVERLGSSDQIKEEQIRILTDRVRIDVNDSSGAKFANTNSMDPLIDVGANGIMIPVESKEQLHEGDIIVYKSEYIDAMLIHRIVKIDTDEKGWYALLKGDNNVDLDPGKVRYEAISKMLVMVVY